MCFIFCFQIFDKLFRLRTIHPWLKWITPPLVQNWQTKGFQVHTWVANTEEEIRRCQQMGVDGVFTDDPQFAKRILK